MSKIIPFIIILLCNIYFHGCTIPPIYIGGRITLLAMGIVGVGVSFSIAAVFKIE